MAQSSVVAALFVCSAFAGPALAGDHSHRGHERGHDLPVAENKLWRAECGACHLAYPPGLLPERSWRAVMDGLDRHFGANAGLDAADRQAITAFLAANAADRSDSRRARKIVAALPADRAPLRITELAWFERKHDELRSDVWQRKEIGSRANCGACHRGAEKGRFDEDEIAVPGAPRRRG